MDYFIADLVRVFTEFNECSNSDLVYSEPEVERDVFNLTIRPRLNSSSFTIENSDFNARDIINFGNKVGFGIGLEAELILPIKKDKWSIFIEPTYQSFEAETVNTEVSVIFGGEIESKITYNSIEIPLGLRHYFLLNENSKIFVDLAYIFDLSSNSKFEFDRSDSSITNAVVLETEQNMAIGVGFKLQEKYSLELRYQASRELIKQNAIWSSDYETFSVIFGYTIF